MNTLIFSTLSQGLIFAIAALGIYITFRILDFPDLSVDGTFTLGAAITAVLVKTGISPYLALAIAVLGGLIAGSVTGILHVKLKITNILSGIIVMIGLYSVNLRIMGKSNIHLFDTVHMFTGTDGLTKLVIVALFAVSIKVLYDVFFKTQMGYVLKALGENTHFVTALGYHPGQYKILGLALANACVALAGGMYAQYQGFADISMGTGIIVSGLAAIVIGEILFKGSRLATTTIVLWGSISYRIILSAALKLGLNASDLKLITAGIMVLILSGLVEKMTQRVKSALVSAKQSTHKTAGEKEVNSHA